MSDEKVSEASVEYEAENKAKEGELVGADESEQLPELLSPPSGYVKSAMFNSVRLRMKEAEFRSYEAAVVARGDAERALAYLDDSFVEGFRGAGRLADVARILDDDQKRRIAQSARAEAVLNDAETAKLQAEDRELQAKHQIELNKLKREVELANVQTQHEQLMSGNVSHRTQTQDDFAEEIFTKYSDDLLDVIEEEIKARGITGEEAEKIRKEAKKAQEDYR